MLSVSRSAKYRLCGFGWRREQNFGSQKPNTCTRVRYFTLCPDPPPTWAIAFVFGLHGDFAGAITRANFFVDRFRGFRVLRLQYFYSPYRLSWSPLQQCYTVITCHFCVPMHIRCPGCILKSKKKFRQQSCRNFYS